MVNVGLTRSEIRSRNPSAERSATPMTYTLATAAEVAGKTKPTIWRAVKSGKISARRLDDGSFRIEPAELDRYLAATNETPPHETAMRSDTGAVLGEMDAKALQEAITLRLTVERLEALLATERARAAELREDREHWRDQARRLAITHEKAAAIVAAPAPAMGSPPVPTAARVHADESERGGLLARLVAAVRG